METVKVESRTTATTISTPLSISLNMQYFKTLPGILKLLQLLFGILCVALAQDPYFAATYFFLFVCWTTLILTVAWIIAFLFNLTEKFSFRWSWILIEFGYTVVVLLFYFLAMVLQFTKFSQHASFWGNYKELHTAAAVFALFNTIAFAISGVLLFLKLRT